MADPGSFHNVLCRLVFELSHAHEAEVAASWKQTEPQLGKHAILRSNPQQHHMSLPAGSSNTHCYLPQTPRENLPLRENPLPRSPDDNLHPRQQSMFKTAIQPVQPTPLTPNLPNLSAEQLMDWNLEDCVIEQSATIRGADLELQSQRSHLRQQEFIDGLPADYLDCLRAQFDRLDTEGDGKISLDKCVRTVQAFTDMELHSQNLIDSLKEFRPTVQAASSEDQPVDKDEYWITFEDFAYLMSCGDFDDELDQSPESKARISSSDVLFALQGAFNAYDEHQMSLKTLAEIQRKKHERLAIFLDVVPAAVILLNALVMGLRQDINPDGKFWQVFEVLFFLFYLSEVVVKMRVFGCSVYWLGPGKAWNWFDILCIVIFLCDMFVTYIVPFFSPGTNVDLLGDLMLMKMLRLARLARLVKVLNYPVFYELKAMIFGVVAGVRVILWAIVLLFVCVLFLGIILNNLVGDAREEFKNVPSSAFTVFRCFTDGCTAYDGTPLHEHLRMEYGFLFIAGYTIAFMFITVGVFNLIMASFIENVVSNTAERKQKELCQKLQSARLSLEAAFIRLISRSKSIKRNPLVSELLINDIQKLSKNDVDGAFRMLPQDLAITKSVFRHWLLDKQFINTLQDADIETSNSSYLFDCLDADMSGELSLKELLEGLMRLRGPITKCDVVGIRMQTRCVYQTLQEKQSSMQLTDPTESNTTGEGSSKVVSKRVSSQGGHKLRLSMRKSNHMSWADDEVPDNAWVERNQQSRVQENLDFL